MPRWGKGSTLDGSYEAEAERILREVEAESNEEAANPLTQARTIEDYANIDGLYDESEDNPNPYGVTLNPNLSAEERADALFWQHYTRGIMVVDGPPGSGKDLFATVVAWKMKRYFNKTAILDFKPRKIFGPYMPFNEQTFGAQLGRLNEVAGFNDKTGSQKKQKEIIGNWVASEGQVLFKNSVAVFQEFRRYFYKRRPFLPLGMCLADVFDIFRHLDLLVIGTCVDARELDDHSCLPKVTYRARAMPAKDEYGRPIPASTVVRIRSCTWMSHISQLQERGQIVPVHVDGLKPRPQLNWKRYVDLYPSNNAQSIIVPKSLR